MYAKEDNDIYNAFLYISRIYEIFRNVGIASHASFKNAEETVNFRVNRNNSILFIPRILFRKLNISWLDLLRGTYHPLVDLLGNIQKSNTKQCIGKVSLYISY